MSTIKEDGTSMLTESAAQDYINELESKIKVLGGSKAKVLERLNEYQGENGPYFLFKDMLLKALDDYDVMDTIKDEVLVGLPDLDDLDSRISDVEYENENKPDDYEIVDNVVDSVTFESRVEDIITDKLNEVKFKLTIEED
jgi:predicted heme/steroid binding protein